MIHTPFYSVLVDGIIMVHMHAYLPTVPISLSIKNYAGHSAHFCRTLKKISGQTNNYNLHWENVVKLCMSL